jgi:hypothetical protein
MYACNDCGRVAVVTDDRDEFGEGYQTIRIIPLAEAIKLRDQLNEVIDQLKKMTIEDCLTLASDCYVGLSSDTDKVTCLFVYGRGIELKDDEEVEIANEIVSALSGFRDHIKPDV